MRVWGRMEIRRIPEYPPTCMAWGYGSLGIWGYRLETRSTPPYPRTSIPWGMGVWGMVQVLPHTPISPDSHTLAVWGYEILVEMSRTPAYPHFRIPGEYEGMEVWEYGDTCSKRAPYPHTWGGRGGRMRYGANQKRAPYRHTPIPGGCGGLGA